MKPMWPDMLLNETRDRSECSCQIEIVTNFPKRVPICVGLNVCFWDAAEQKMIPLPVRLGLLVGLTGPIRPNETCYFLNSHSPKMAVQSAIPEPCNWSRNSVRAINAVI